MSDTNISEVSEKEIEDGKATIAKSAVEALKKHFPTAPYGKTWEEIEQGFKDEKVLFEICDIPEEYLEEQYERAEDFFAHENFNDCKDTVGTLCILNSLDYRFWLLLAHVCQRLEEYEESRTAYRMTGLVTNGLHPMAFLGIGYCSLCLGDVDTAREALENGKAICLTDRQADRKMYDLMDSLLKNCDQK